MSFHISHHRWLSSAPHELNLKTLPIKLPLRRRIFWRKQVLASLLGVARVLWKRVTRELRRAITVPLAVTLNYLLSRDQIPISTFRLISATSLCAKQCLSNTPRRLSSFPAALELWMSCSKL